MSASPQSSATLPTPTTTVLISHTQFIDRNLNLILPKIISLLPAPNNARFFYRAGVLCEIIENDHDLTTFKFITTNLSQRKIGIAINEIWEAKLKRTYEDQRDLQEEKDKILESACERADIPLLLLLHPIQRVFCPKRELEPVALWDDVARAIVERNPPPLASAVITWFSWLEELCDNPRLISDLRTAEMSTHHRRSPLSGDVAQRAIRQIDALPATPPRSPMTRFKHRLKNRVVAIRDTM